ncbi:hypothetical protein IV500_04695 [Paeniglutamicibacter antarcticus]|uniref:Uncharacterized protein n=1 Tax=Arthrobacter terrae TaxID=2935737 RepID=A0A931G3I7_9MICC|nr:hypothetical protein [Arthrobacter terrae]MBG0738716.1 hypothetical protein [Arthrobacter terrae]
MNVYTLFPGDTLLLVAGSAFLIGATLIVALVLGVGAKRRDSALTSMLKQISATHNAPLRKTYLVEIVDETGNALALSK